MPFDADHEGFSELANRKKMATLLDQRGIHPRNIDATGPVSLPDPGAVNVGDENNVPEVPHRLEKCSAAAICSYECTFCVDCAVGMGRSNR